MKKGYSTKASPVQKVVDNLLDASKDKAFRDRIAELLQQISNLAKKEAAGFKYKRFWVEPTKVRAHKRKGYYVRRAVKR